MRLFEYAIIYEGKKDKEGEWVERPELITPVTNVLAEDEAQAQIIAARAIPEKYLERLDRIAIAVRPF